MSSLLGLPLDVLVFALPLAVAIGGLWWRSHRHKVQRDGLARLVARDRSVPTGRPCGLDPGQLAGRFAATPRGDRRYGIRYGIERPVEVELDGRPVRIHLGCFQWWHEVRVRTNKTTRYRRESTTVAVARLPVSLPGWVAIRPEGLLGRVGLRRGDQQLESEEFNRRFHVETSDPTLSVRLLDAATQHRLLTTAVGRSLHLGDDLVVLGGSPDHRDGSLPGVIGELPAAAQDLQVLLRAVPAQVWRLARPHADDRSDATGGW